MDQLKDVGKRHKYVDGLKAVGYAKDIPMWIGLKNDSSKRPP